MKQNQITTDEKTRKDLVEFVLYKAGYLLDEETEHRFVKYLEKQKEQQTDGKAMLHVATRLVYVMEGWSRMPNLFRAVTKMVIRKKQERRKANETAQIRHRQGTRPAHGAILKRAIRRIPQCILRC